MKFRVGDRVHFQGDPEDTGTVIDVDGTEIWGVPNNVKWDRGTLSHWADDRLVLISRHVKTADEIATELLTEHRLQFDVEIREMLIKAVEEARL